MTGPCLCRFRRRRRTRGFRRRRHRLQPYEQTAVRNLVPDNSPAARSPQTIRGPSLRCSSPSCSCQHTTMHYCLRGSTAGLSHSSPGYARTPQIQPSLRRSIVRRSASPACSLDQPSATPSFMGSCASQPNQVRARGLARRRQLMMFERSSAGGREARMGSRKIASAQRV
jgi:hypothetical protein